MTTDREAEMVNELESMRQELLGWDILLSMQRQRMAPLTALWRRDHPERKHVIPDFGDLAEWAVGKISYLEANGDN